MREQRFFVHEIHERREKNHRVVLRLLELSDSPVTLTNLR